MSIQAAAAAAAADVQNRPPRLPQSGRGGTGVTVLPLRPAIVVDREKVRMFVPLPIHFFHGAYSCSHARTWPIFIHCVSFDISADQSL